MGKNTAFAGTTVVSTRKESSIEDCIIRRRVDANGNKIVTGEVSEAMIDLLLATPGGLKRRHTAVNADNVAKAAALHNAGKTRAEAEAELGVKPAVYRRLLAAAGIEMRRYNPILTPDNVLRAVQVQAKYDLRDRKQLVAAAKELGVNARNLRRLMSKALETMTVEQIGAAIQKAREANAAAAPATPVEVAATATAAVEAPAAPQAPVEAPVAEAPAEVPPLRRASDMPGTIEHVAVVAATAAVAAIAAAQVAETPAV